MWWITPTTEGEPECELLGPFALIVQGSMGLIAVLSLVYKRNQENPRRPWWIWFFDVSKQIVGSAGLHMLNLLMSIIFSQSGLPELDDNPCTWYFLNILVDTTLGVPVLWFFLFILHTTAFRLGVKDILSGEYGEPPKWSAFLKQAVLYLIAMCLMKCVLYLFFWWMPFIDDLGQFLISWTGFDARVQVIFVMLVFPLIMNTIQYYLIDSIIQSPAYEKVNSEPDFEENSNSNRRTVYGAITPESSQEHLNRTNSSSSSSSSTLRESEEQLKALLDKGSQIDIPKF